MQITFGKEGCAKTWQAEFPELARCCQCGGQARIAFVAHEAKDGERLTRKDCLCSLHATTGKKGGLWLHDVCAVAVYFCPDCGEVTALYNQA